MMTPHHVVLYSGLKKETDAMPPAPDSIAAPSAPAVYAIRLQGHLDGRWAAGWFGGLTITLEADGSTLLTGLVVDQAALHGLLKKVRDLGMPLLSVNRVESGQANPPEAKSSRPIR
jgi:hypothetical protein